MISQIQILIDDGDNEYVDRDFTYALQRLNGLKVLGFSKVGNTNDDWAQELDADEAEKRDYNYVERPLWTGTVEVSYTTTLSFDIFEEFGCEDEGEAMGYAEESFRQYLMEGEAPNSIDFVFETFRNN